MLSDEIKKILDHPICDNKTRAAFLKRLKNGLLTRDENQKTHFCLYFLPYNKKDRKFFIIHHKKSGLWLSPGGHIDGGEMLLPAINREISEELGMSNFFKELPPPFFLYVTPIENKKQTCKIHYDIWYLVPTDGSNFKIDFQEFHDAKWLTRGEAEKIVTDLANKKAFEIIERNTLIE